MTTQWLMLDHLQENEKKSAGYVVFSMDTIYIYIYIYDPLTEQTQRFTGSIWGVKSTLRMGWYGSKGSELDPCADDFQKNVFLSAKKW